MRKLLCLALLFCIGEANENEIQLEEAKPFCESPIASYDFEWGESECCSYFPPPNRYFNIIPYGSWRIGDGLSYERGYQSVGAFLEKSLNPRLFTFLDLQLLRLHKGRVAVNAGVGGRAFSVGYLDMVGANIFYDYRRIDDGNLHQIGLGVELLGKCWDLRINGYIPVGKNKIFKDETFFNYPDNYVIHREEFTRGMWGIDVEFGSYIFDCCCWSFYAGAGPYFYESECCNSLVGGRGRVLLEVCQYLAFEASVTHDRLFNTNWQGEITLYIPFCKLRQCFIDRWLPVRRNDVIVAERVCNWETNW